MKLLPKKIIVEAIFIIILAVVLGFSSNQFHSNKIKISFSRPPIEFVEDNIAAQTLPDVEINSTESIEPLFLRMKQVVTLLSKNQALLLDARSEKEYRKGHIPGARNFSPKAFLNNKNITETLPKDKWLICYCGGPSCDKAELLAYELIYAGYKKVAVYRGGFEEWKKRNNSQIKTGAH